MCLARGLSTALPGVFASFHSELRSLPDSESNWKRQLWQGKEESLGGPGEGGDIWNHGATDRFTPFLLREATPITKGKKLRTVREEVGTLGLQGVALNLPLYHLPGSGLWALSSADQSVLWFHSVEPWSPCEGFCVPTRTHSQYCSHLVA